MHDNKLTSTVYARRQWIGLLSWVDFRAMGSNRSKRQTSRCGLCWQGSRTDLLPWQRVTERSAVPHMPEIDIAGYLPSAFAGPHDERMLLSTGQFLLFDRIRDAILAN